MGMYTKKILELICQRPGIRLVEIADLVDCDFDQVESSIAHEIERGRILVEEVRAPNLRMTKAFTATRSLMAEYPAPTKAPTPTLAPMTARSPTPTPTLGAEDHPKPAQDKQLLTAVDKAVAFIKSNGGKASPSELREVLGLGINQYPSTFLSAGKRSGRLEMRDDRWVLGPTEIVNIPEDQGPAPEIAPSFSENADPDPQIQETVTAPSIEIPDFLKAKVAADSPIDPPSSRNPPAIKTFSDSQEDSPNSECRPAFDCGLWSSGDLHLRRHGQTLTVLTAAEVEHMKQFLGKIAA